MSVGLPRPVYGSGIRKSGQVAFGGYDHRKGTGDGSIWDMTNMSAAQYPLLTTRERRRGLQQISRPNGIIAGDKLYWMDGEQLYEDGVQIATLADSPKQMCFLGNRLIIFPDKVCYDTASGELTRMEAAWSGEAQIRDGTYAGVSAMNNTICSSGTDWAALFRAGDAVSISGSSTETNNKTAIIREIDGDELRFYENTFSTETEAQLTVSRTVPELDFIFQHQNRLWGCKGDSIWCSKLGDPFNFYVFDGLSTDSFNVDVGSAGDFTAAISYRGYPCFFKEDVIYKVYGDRPASYQVVDSVSMGVAAGSGRSLAVAGETLFYLHRSGITAYTGGIPQSIAAPFGGVQYRNAVGGSDGIRYYVSMEDLQGLHQLFVYDTRHNLWHREDGLAVEGFAWLDGLHALTDRELTLIGGQSRMPAQYTEEPLCSRVEFGDITGSTTDRKGVSKLRLRVELEEGASLSVLIRFDSEAKWKVCKTITAQSKRSVTVPIIPRRCDHFRIALEGVGGWTLHAMTTESYTGSDR